MLILKNRVLRRGNVHIWVVPPCYVVDILMLRNSVFRLRILQKWVVLFRQGLICQCSGIANSGCETFKCGSAVMKGLRFDESQESRFQAAKRSEMCSAVPQGG